MNGARPHDPAAIPIPRPLPTSGYFAVGIFVLLSSIVRGLVAFPAPFALGSAILGAGLIAFDARRRAIGDASQLLAASFRAVALGRLADADSILDQADKKSLVWVRRIADVQRAIVHLRRGDLEKARIRLDNALARPLGRYARENATYQIEAAHALRAFVRASLGDSEGARRDIAAVRAHRGVSAESLARASLAEAIVLQRSGGRDELRALLDRDKGLLLESSHPRERAIVRAYQRMVRVTTTTAYRAAPALEEDAHRGDEPQLVDWVARVVPAAAPFVRAPRASTGPTGPRIEALPRMRVRTGDDAHHDRPTTAAVAEHRTRRVRAIAAISAVSAGLVGLGAVILGLSAAMPDPHGFSPSPRAVFALPTLPIPFVAVALFAIAAAITAMSFRFSQRGRRASRDERGRLGTARDAIGRGDLDAASAALRGLETREHDRLAAHASALQATIAERRCDAEAMLEAASTGLGRLDRVDASDAVALQPELVAQRALALTLLDRENEAAAELSILAHRTSPMRERDLFRVRLIGLARRGELAEAARWVEQEAGDLPLGVRDELLADLVRALASPEGAGLGEIERLEHELRTEPEHRRWIEWVAPAVLRAFRSANEGEEAIDTDHAAGPLRVATEGAPAPASMAVEVEAEVDVDREAQAEAEAAGEADRRSRAIARG